MSVRAACFAVLLLAVSARADDAPATVVTRAAALAGGGTARLTSTWGATDTASGLALGLGAGKPTSLGNGYLAGAVESAHGVTVVAYLADGDKPLRLRAVTRGKAGPALGEAHALARPGGRARDMAFAVAIAPLPAGFAVFFQEIQTDDPSAAHTYLVHLDDTGAPTDAGVEVPVPWSLAAAAWNGVGFHLGLIFPGYGGAPRLSMVSLTAEGQPQQHPDWASAEGDIRDVHLVAADGKVRAVYRGGAAGDHMLQSDVTAIGSWGSEPAAATDLGALAADQAIVIGADGKPTRVKRQ